MSAAALSALGVQGRVIHALILRETKTRYGRLKLGYLWAFIEPIMHVAIFYAIYELMRQKPTAGMPLVLFLITGIVPFLMFRHVMQQVTTAVDSNRALLTFPQVTIFDLVFARATLEAVTMVLVLGLLILGAVFLGHTARVEDILRVTVALALLTAIGVGAGMAFCAIGAVFPSVKNAINPFLGRPLFFTSGLFFTADMLPTAAREIALYNPLLHIIEYLRSGFFYEFESQYYDLGYVAMWALGSVAFGFALMHMMRNRLSND